MNTPAYIEDPALLKYGTGWNLCPVCQGNEIEGSAFDGDGGQVWQPLTCLTCGSTWTEVYDASHREVDEVSDEFLMGEIKAEAVRALRAAVLNMNLREYLVENDPKLLEQLDEAAKGKA